MGEKERRENKRKGCVRCVITARLLGSFSALRSARYTDNEQVALLASFAFLRRRHFFDCPFLFFFSPAVSSSSFLSRFRRSTTSPRQPAKRHWEERENKDGRKVPRVVAFSTEEARGGIARCLGAVRGCRPEQRRRDGGLDGVERERERGILCLNVAVIRMPEWCARKTHTDLETNLSRLRGCDSSFEWSRLSLLLRERIENDSSKRVREFILQRVRKKVALR